MEELKKWAIHSAIRAIKTAAQTAAATIGASALITQVDWAMVGSAAALAFVLSVITSVAGIPEVDDGASVVKLVKDGTEVKGDHVA